MHTIQYNRELGLIEITVAGCWREDHFDRFVLDYHAAIMQFAPAAKPMTLYNYTGALIQPQAIVSRMRAFAAHPAMVNRKVAMYTEGVLARQQARRVAEGRDNMRLFDCRADAIAYLLDGREVGASAAG